MVRIGGVRHAAVGGVLLAAIASGSVAMAHSGESASRRDSHSNSEGSTTFSVRLTGLEEDPLALSTSGSGTLRVRINDAGTRITYRLSYDGLEAPVTQSHIHFGGRAQSGGVAAYLCSNVGGAPAGTPTCPAVGGAVDGTLRAANVVGPAAQGIAPGEFSELVSAIRNGTAYANVHSEKYQGGEIRGQLDHRH